MKRIELSKMFRIIESTTDLRNNSDNVGDWKSLRTEQFVLLPLNGKPFEVLELDDLECFYDKDGILYILTDQIGSVEFKGNKYAIHDPWSMNEVDFDLRKISVVLANRLVVLDLTPTTGEVLQVIVYGQTVTEQ